MPVKYRAFFVTPAAVRGWGDNDRRCLWATVGSITLAAEGGWGDRRW